MNPIFSTLSSIPQFALSVKESLSSLAQQVQAVASRAFSSIKTFFISLFYPNQPRQGSEPRVDHPNREIIQPPSINATTLESTSGASDDQDDQFFDFALPFNTFDPAPALEPTNEARVLNPEDYEASDSEDDQFLECALGIPRSLAPEEYMVRDDGDEDEFVDMEERSEPQGRAEAGGFPTPPAQVRPQQEVSRLEMTDDEWLSFDKWIHEVYTCIEQSSLINPAWLTVPIKFKSLPQVDFIKIVYKVKQDATLKHKIQTIGDYILNSPLVPMAQTCLSGFIPISKRKSLVILRDLVKAINKKLGSGNLINVEDLTEIFLSRPYQQLQKPYQEALIEYLCDGLTDEKRESYAYRKIKGKTLEALGQFMGVLTQLEQAPASFDWSFFEEVKQSENLQALKAGPNSEEMKSKLNQLFYLFAKYFFGLTPNFLDSFSKDLAREKEVIFLYNEYYQSCMHLMLESKTDQLRHCDLKEETLQQVVVAFSNGDLRRCAHLLFPDHFSPLPPESA